MSPDQDPAWLLTRTFTEAAGAVSIRIGRPVECGKDEWRCAFQVGAGPPAHAYGLDGLQALQMAIEGARQQLGQRHPTATWIGGEPGDAGIPALIPIAFGARFRRHLEALVDEEVEQFAAAAIRRDPPSGT